MQRMCDRDYYIKLMSRFDYRTTATANAHFVSVSLAQNKRDFRSSHYCSAAKFLDFQNTCRLHLEIHLILSENLENPEKVLKFEVLAPYLYNFFR